MKWHETVPDFNPQVDMNNDELLLRQQRLLVRSAELRLNFSNQAQVLKTPLALADQAKTGLQWLYHHPQWPLAALVVLIVIRPRRAIAWSGRLWWGWQTFKRARNWISRLPLQALSR